MATNTIEDLLELGQRARAASRILARLPSDVKDQALHNIAQALEDRHDDVLAANREDYETSKADGLSESLLDRLLLTPDRLHGLAESVRGVAALPDPISETMDATTLANGLRVSKRRVPLGVVGSIYESRPNVTIDISTLCLKSGNACLLRGGKESLNSNRALVALSRQAVSEAGMPVDAIQFVDNTNRALVDTMLGMRDYIDLLVPRGSDSMIRYVAEHATMPAVTGGVGVCHTYVDSAAEIDKAAKIVYNAKVQRPSVCNALDTILVHVDAAPTFLPKVARELRGAGVELHCDHRALSILGLFPGGLGEDASSGVLPASEDDWGKEFLSLTAAVKVVDSMDDALEHIETYGSGHSEAIVTDDYTAAMRFMDEVDAAAVFVNASTRFNDGGQFGLGAEVGISTQKFHARGPMGLRELTSYKWVVMGEGQTRE